MRRLIYTGLSKVDMKAHQDYQIIHLPILTSEVLPAKEVVDWTEFDWIVFTSSEGVKAFLGEGGYLNQLGLSYEFEREFILIGKNVTQLRIGVIGVQTEKTLKHFGGVASFIPSQSLGTTFAKEFKKSYPNQRILLIVGASASKRFEESIGNKWVKRLEVYDVKNHEINQNLIKECIRDMSVEGVFVTSSLGVKALHQILWQAQKNNPGFLVMAIGQTTRQALDQYNIRNEILSNHPSVTSHIEMWMKKGRI